MLRRTGIAAVILGALLCSPVLAHGQSVGSSYPNMAPLVQYLMDRATEIRLAKSAAPAAISDNAQVMVLGPQGYTVAEHGSNGFVCIVERSWTTSPDDPEFWNPKIRSPICFNPAAVRSVLPWAYKKTAMVLAGLSKLQIVDGIKDALLKHEVPAVEAGSMSYMMSPTAYLGDSIGRGPAHLMFFGPNREDGAGWGENLNDSPIFRVRGSETAPDPMRTYIVPMSTWSDGKPVAAAKHSH